MQFVLLVPVVLELSRLLGGGIAKQLRLFLRIAGELHEQVLISQASLLI